MPGNVLPWSGFTWSSLTPRQYFLGSLCDLVFLKQLHPANFTYIHPPADSIPHQSNSHILFFPPHNIPSQCSLISSRSSINNNINNNNNNNSSPTTSSSCRSINPPLMTKAAWSTVPRTKARRPAYKSGPGPTTPGPLPYGRIISGLLPPYRGSRRSTHRAPPKIWPS